MSYGYCTPYNSYSPIEYAQPLPEIHIHLNSVAAQLGLTQEEAREILADQEQWMREEEEQEQGAGRHPIQITYQTAIF